MACDSPDTCSQVGCDACGLYPIVGDRWRCRDCPERIGFDLCGACHTEVRPPLGSLKRLLF